MRIGGFTMSRVGTTRVWLRDDIASALRAAGLEDPANWERRLVLASSDAPGRGSIARAPLPDGGPRIVMKRLERGGWIARLWRGRFAGTARIVANVTLPELAVRGGVATPRAVALIAMPGPPGFWRGWLAVEEISAAEDLATRLARGPLARAEVLAVAGVLRTMHAAGLDHRDLNLGNLLVRTGAAAPGAFVVDLDGARWHGRPLSFAARQRALRRLERSCLRVLGEPAGHAAAEAFYQAYAQDDPELASRLASGRAWGKSWLALRGLGRARDGGQRR